jgi:hypothetical protein
MPPSARVCGLKDQVYVAGSDALAALQYEAIPTLVSLSVLSIGVHPEGGVTDTALPSCMAMLAIITSPTTTSDGFDRVRFVMVTLVDEAVVARPEMMSARVTEAMRRVLVMTIVNMRFFRKVRFESNEDINNYVCIRFLYC